MRKVFEPVKVGQLELKNRLIAAPMMSNTDIGGYVTRKGLDLYEERAGGGFALVHVEASAVRPDGRPFDMHGLWDDRFLPGLRSLAEAIHRGGAKASIQLLHAGRQALAPLNRVPVWAPSERTPPWARQKPRALTVDECDLVIDAYVGAALRAKQAGFDCVLYHGTHGFLPQQFMSPWTNVGREDKYAGPTAFITELVKRTRKAVGPGLALIFRIPGSEHLGKHGLTPQMMAEVIAPALQEAGIDALDVTAGSWLRFDVIVPGLYFPRACLVPYAELIKRHVKVPVAGGGRVNDFRLVERLVEQERVDLVYIGRQALADPDLPKKALEGRYDEIRKCIACDGCSTRRLTHSGMVCAINPTLGKIGRFPMTPAAIRKKVLVVGGGVGGMEAAYVAALRGHEVTLCEKTEKLGGQVNIASAIPRVYTRELHNYARQLTDWLKKTDVQIMMKTEVTLERVKAMKPGAVILATGSGPKVPLIRGTERPIVMTEDDCLKNDERIGKRVVIIGGGRGAEIAVSQRRAGRGVILLEEGRPANVGLAPYVKGQRLMTLRRMVWQSGATILTEVKVTEIKSDGVSYVDKDGQKRTTDADTVILTLGRTPDKELAEVLAPYVIGELDGELIEAGDCVAVRDQLNAIHDGFYAAYGIGDPVGKEMAELARVQGQAGLQTVIPQPGIDMSAAVPIMLALPYMAPGDDIKPDWEPTSPVLETILTQGS